MKKIDISERQKYIDELLIKKIPFIDEDTLLEATNYSVFNGGKRLRPILMREAYKIFSKNETDTLQNFMVALELIHSFSLVHDDLPAIDNDDYRRGKLSTHKAFGEAVGILTGDVMLNSAYEVAVSTFFYEDGIDTRLKAEALEILAGSTKFMLCGEMLDIFGEFKDNKDFLKMYDYKTAKLFVASFCIGAILAMANEEDIDNMSRLGICLGMMFQIQDDILDMYGDSSKLGKPTGSDEKNDKQNFVLRFGKNKAELMVTKFKDDCLEILDKYGKDADFIRDCVEYIYSRDR